MNWSDFVSAWGSSSPPDSYQLDELYGMASLQAGINHSHMNHVQLLYIKTIYGTQKQTIVTELVQATMYPGHLNSAQYACLHNILLHLSYTDINNIISHTFTKMYI
jgi:hypothetical protein